MVFARRLLVLLPLACVLAGCRQGSNAADEPVARSTTPVEAPHRIADARPVVACFGDSLTAGYGTDPGQTYPDYLQADLDRAGQHIRVINDGVSGDTTKDGIARLRDVIAQKPRIVVLEFGGNDGLRGLPLAETQANLNTMITRLTQAGIRVALAGITLPPDYGADYIHRFNAMYTTLAAQHHLRLLPFLLQGAFGVPGSMQADRTHATAQGNQRVARNVLGLIRPML